MENVIESAPRSPHFLSLLKRIGPGLLMAGAAIGVSHVVQSTRAGATYGFQLIALVVLVNALKYPFFEAGHRYTVATGESLLDGYRRLGKGFLWGFMVLNLITAIISIAGVTLVTAILAPKIFGINWKPGTWSAVMMAVCCVILIVGHYRWLNRFMKVLMVTLFIATVLAFSFALGDGRHIVEGFVHPSPWKLAALPFLVALMGWMPAPIELSVWQSLWIQASEETTKHRTTRAEANVDFNVGYCMTTVLAVLFICLGSFVMYGTGTEFAKSGAAFANQFIELYTNKLGLWVTPIIAATAFTTMFSTTLTVIDAYPRSLAKSVQVAWPRVKQPFSRLHNVMILVGAGAGWLLIFAALSGKLDFTRMIDIATTISFLAAPAFAFLNYRLINSRHVPNEFRPGKALHLLSLAGLVFLTSISLLFIYTLVIKS
ncbi:Nramp family divalent metal transporter [Planctomycetota bacterium]